MPAPRKPTAILKLSGAFRKDPARGKQRDGEPIDDRPIGPAPAGFNAAQAALWDELIAMSYPGVLCRAHRWSLELLVRLQFRTRVGTATPSDLNCLRLLLAAHGLHPADQSRVKVAPVLTGNRFADV